MKNRAIVSSRMSVLIVLLAGCAAGWAGCSPPAETADGEVGTSAQRLETWECVYACDEPQDVDCRARAGAVVTACLTPCAADACVSACVAAYDAAIDICTAERVACVEGCDGAGSTPPATCSDGIQNQGETSIDCGGPCTACPTCSDGIQNQCETDIDCGGPCPPCQ